MADELVFYTNPMSRARTVRWMLEEVGQPYRDEVMGYGSAGMKSAAYLAINPMGKVPAIRHGATVVTEVVGICAYLADAFPEAGLAPPLADPERGPYFRWLFFCAGPLEAAVTDKALGVEVPDNRRGMVGYDTMATTIDVLEQAVAGKEFLAGEKFTTVDLIVAAYLGFFLQFGSIEARPAFTSFTELHAARPAAVRARAIDDGLIAAQQQQQQQQQRQQEA